MDINRKYLAYIMLFVGMNLLINFGTIIYFAAAQNEGYKLVKYIKPTHPKWYKPEEQPTPNPEKPAIIKTDEK